MTEVVTGAFLNKEHLYEQVADLLEEEIVKNYKDGERLPSELKLAEQYQVSRTIIREAMKCLKARGLIDSKTGSGSYVTKPEAQDIADVVSRIAKMNRYDYTSVFDMRMILEIESVTRAARYATEEDIKEMEDLLEKLKDPKLSVIERSQYDFDFHYQIAKASQNPLLALMTEAIGTICLELLQKNFLLQDSLQDSIVRHRLIMNQIRGRDEKEARRAMKEHLEKSKRNYEEYMENQDT